eukprot:scaffold1551_cov166-Amphora_coffeaeformis.AAC.2
MDGERWIWSHSWHPVPTDLVQSQNQNCWTQSQRLACVQMDVLLGTEKNAILAPQSVPGSLES